MKYKGVGTRMGHKLIIRKRESAFDKKKRVVHSSFGTLEDHTEMKTWEYASFQKAQFAKRRSERRKRNIIFIISGILAILVLILIAIAVSGATGPSFMRNI